MSERPRNAAATQSEATVPQILAVFSIVVMFLLVALSLIGIVSL